MNIASISSEVDPFSKTGGLGDVARSLPKSLHRLGANVIIITPFYKLVADTKQHPVELLFDQVELRLDKETTIKVSYYRGWLMPKLPVYLVSIDKYFGRKKEIYGSHLENTRFYVFNVAALRLLSLLKFKADIIHCHDWQTGLIPELLKKQFKRSKTLAQTATVFTSHNLTFQLGHNWWEIPGDKRDTGRTPLPMISNESEVERLNFAKRAILYADAINTVSETYAEEILQPRFGQDLHRTLQNRQNKLFGVVNGIDYNEYNPLNDPGLKANFDANHIDRKQENKRELQRRFRLPRVNHPVIVMTSRIAEQKGWNILLPLLPNLLTKNLQIIVLGDGDKDYMKQLKQLQKKFPKTFHVTTFNDKTHLETLLYAGGDIILLPSHFEPCGTSQLKGLRYGCVPVVREVGGLGETVSNFDPMTNPTGIGFVFKAYSSEALMFTLARSIETYKHQEVWKQLIIRGMKASFSWDLPAKKYLKLFRLARKLRQESL